MGHHLGSSNSSGFQHPGALYYNGRYSCTTPGCHFKCWSQFDFERHSHAWNAPQILTGAQLDLNQQFGAISSSSASLGYQIDGSVHNRVIGLTDIDEDFMPTIIQEQDHVPKAGQVAELSNAGSPATTLATDPVLSIPTIVTLQEDSPATETSRPDNAKLKRFVCPQEDYGLSFKRSSDLSRHRKKHLPRTLHCLEPGCRFRGVNGFYRRDKLVQHQTTKHQLGLRHVCWGFLFLLSPDREILEASKHLDQHHSGDRTHLSEATKHQSFSFGHVETVHWIFVQTGKMFDLKTLRQSTAEETDICRSGGG